MRSSSSSSSSSRSLTRPVQQQWWSWRSSSGPPSPHIISGEVELLKATVRFALVGVCYISEEHARLSGPPHHRDTLGKERFLVSCASVRWACCCQNHLAGPVKKVVCILLLSGFQCWCDDGGLFLVMDAGWWLLFYLLQRTSMSLHKITSGH